MKHTKQTYRRAASLLLALCMILGLFPGGIVTASAAELTASSATWSEDSTISEDVTIDGGVTVADDITLTIPEGKTLTVTSGISIASGKTLTVAGAGTLNVTGSDSSDGSNGSGTNNGNPGGDGGAGGDSNGNTGNSGSGGNAVTGTIAYASGLTAQESDNSSTWSGIASSGSTSTKRYVKSSKFP